MRYAIVLLALLAAACSKDSGTNPIGHDPTALITNLSPDTLVFTWTYPNGSLPIDSLKGAGTYCERFTATAADSAYLTVTTREWDDSAKKVSSSSPWFTVTSAPAWRVNVTNTQGAGASIQILEDQSGVQC